MRRVWALALVLAGCSQIFGLDPPAATDAGADAALCTAASTTCASADVLRTCSATGALPVDTQCTWGCVEGPAHCGTLMPSAGTLTADDLTTPQGLGDVVLMAGTVIESDDGQIGTALMPMGIRMAGDGINNGIDYEVRGNVAVFRMKSLSINGPVLALGLHAIAIVVLGNVTIEAPFDMRGSCAMNIAGPGGFDGGPRGAAGMGPGGGGVGATGGDGGGGGGYGAGGGRGGGSMLGQGPSGGSAYGSATIAALVGGSGGAGGGSPTSSGPGGGGGGALQIASNGAITIGASGGINAGGCGGKGNVGNTAGGGGGGAGGTILLEASTITIIGMLAVNGGGGAAGSDGQNAGQAGQLDRNSALGGVGNGGSGGNGGAGATLGGGPGQTSANGGGGGAGAVGRMRFNTKSGSVTTTPQMVLSPALDDAPTSTTQGAAAVL